MIAWTGSLSTMPESEILTPCAPAPYILGTLLPCSSGYKLNPCLHKLAHGLKLFMYRAAVVIPLLDPLSREGASYVLRSMIGPCTSQPLPAVLSAPEHPSMPLPCWSAFHALACST